jgi:hypothetical protein
MPRLVRNGIILVLAVLFFGVVLVSPSIIQLYSKSVRLDWPSLATIGSAYGFSSALISALAFGAITWSIRQQTIESRAQRRETHRATHMRFWELGLKDPYLLACYPMRREEMGVKKRYYYLNLTMWWWHYNFQTGLMNEDAVRFEAGYLFRGAAGRQYFQQLEQHISDHPRWPSSWDERFFAIVSDEYERALRSGPAIPFALGDRLDEASKAQPRLGLAELAGSLALGAGFGWLVGRLSRRSFKEVPR